MDSPVAMAFVPEQKRMPLQRLAWVLLLLSALWPAARAELPGGDRLWLAPAGRVPAVDLYFFWSSRCPHCLDARPFVESLRNTHPWIRVHSLEILESPENVQRLVELARTVGFEPSSVPIFVWCGRHATGYAGPEVTARLVLDGLTDCYRQHYGPLPDEAGEAAPPDGKSAGRPEQLPRIEVPWLGSLDPGDHALPLLAVLLGALDAFNPCAFFILLFLLSLLVNGRSRPRMLLIGGLYVTVSGLVYFAFMAAWLNLFQLLEGVKTITVVAGLIAVVFGLLNIKDYVWLRRGATLSLSGNQRSRLFKRMRGLLAADRLPTLMLGTLALAAVANSYELLCTMGLPMVFTRILTLEQLPALHYYGYLALYNLVYVIPLATIVGLFVASMGRHKLSESGGRFLKLLSGCMMGSLGVVLLADPDVLSQPLLTVLLILASVALALLIHWVGRQKGDGGK